VDSAEAVVVDSCPTEVADMDPEARGDRSRSIVLPLITHQLARDRLPVVPHTPLLPVAPLPPHMMNDSPPKSDTLERQDVVHRQHRVRPDGVVGLERDTCSSDGRTVRLLQRQRPHRSLQRARTRHRLNPRGKRKLNPKNSDDGCGDRCDPDLLSRTVS
jgi:hypothetical protein